MARSRHSGDPEFLQLDRLVAKLPFALDDDQAIGERFVRWREEDCETSREEVELWTYCWVRRFFLVKLVRFASRGPNDLDELVVTAYDRVERKRATVRQPMRFAHWVSVTCRNTWVNFLRDRRGHVSMDDQPEGSPLRPVSATSADEHGDDGYLFSAVLAALEEMPPYLRDIARRRLLEEESYEEISEATGKPIPNLRAYVARVIRRLRENPHVRDYAGRLDTS